LLDWKDVFNKFDERMCSILHARRKELVLTDKEDVVSEADPTSVFETDMHELKTILKFTAQVLENSLFKDVYNSAEVRTLCRLARNITSRLPLDGLLFHASYKLTDLLYLLFSLI